MALCDVVKALPKNDTVVVAGLDKLHQLTATASNRRFG
jgi:hypothetical protein